MRLPAALLALVLAAGCSSDNPRAAKAEPTPTAGVASPTAVATPVAAATGKVALLDAAFSPRGGFSSPTGNIQCVLSVDDLICNVLSHTWDAPDPGDNCDKRYATLGIRADGRADLRTACYLVNEERPPALSYGSGLQLGDLRCVSEQSGMTCLDVATQQGFTVSRTELQLSPRASALTREEATRSGVLPAGFTAAFLTPTANLSCYFYGDQLSCQVREHRWLPEPYDESTQGSCHGDPGTAVELRAGQRGRAITDCRSDANPGTAFLDYGKSLQVGTIRCTSARTGLTCTSGKHGFEVSRERFRGF